MLCYVVLLT